jgi:hypothetical protein
MTLLAKIVIISCITAPILLVLMYPLWVSQFERRWNEISTGAGGEEATTLFQRKAIQFRQAYKLLAVTVPVYTLIAIYQGVEMVKRDDYGPWLYWWALSASILLGLLVMVRLGMRFQEIALKRLRP